jgi:soluble lytic murein transglycosylase-like protein
VTHCTLLATQIFTTKVNLKLLSLLVLLICSSRVFADVIEIDSGGAHRIAVDHRPTSSEIRLQSGAALPADAYSTIPQLYLRLLFEAADRNNLSPALLEAVVWQESRWHANARSPAGAIGLAQLMPGTARNLGIDATDPMANLEGGARYLRLQLDRFHGDLEKALAAYNAGPRRVERANGIPAIRETQVYVAAVMNRLSKHARSN